MADRGNIYYVISTKSTLFRLTSKLFKLLVVCYCQYAFEQFEAVDSLNGAITYQAFSFTVPSNQIAYFLYHK